MKEGRAPPRRGSTPASAAEWLWSTMRPAMIRDGSLFTLLVSLLAAGSLAGEPDWPVYDSNPFRIELAPAQHVRSHRGGIVVADLDGDKLPDFLVTTRENESGPGRSCLAAYRHDGGIMWVQDDADLVLEGKSEDFGLPGTFGPGVSAADPNGDGRPEVIHLDSSNGVVIRNGASGEVLRRFEVALPDEPLNATIGGTLGQWWGGSAKKGIKHLIRAPSRWSHFQVVNLRGAGEDEIILQADPLPFRWLKAVSLRDGSTLWEYHEYVGLQHGGFRAFDVDGDGFDEVLGGMMIEEDGALGCPWRYRRYPGHLDALLVGDVLPTSPGLEWVVLEETRTVGDRTTLLGPSRIHFSHSENGWEPQAAAVGEFDPGRPGLEIWCRSRFEVNQRPWVVSADGRTIARYRIDDHSPEGWTPNGIAAPSTIDWDGGRANLIAVQERHSDGRIALLEPMTGKFVRFWEESCARLLVADVAGDPREEIIVVNSERNEIRIYWNEKPSLSPRRDRYWTDRNYRHGKLNYNLYSR